MTSVPSSELRDRIAAAITADAMKPRAERVGLVSAMLATVQPELDRLRAERDAEAAQKLRIAAQAAEEEDRLRAELAAMTDLRDRAIARQDDLRADMERIRTRENGVRTVRRQALRELEQARQQTEAAHCRLHYIAARLERLDVRDDPTGVAGDVGPYLDGPLHPQDLADYRATASGI